MRDQSACAFPRGLDRLLDVLGAALRDVGEDVLLAVRHDCLERLAEWTSLPPMIIGIEIRSACIACSRACSSARSGVPGA